jgi:hypothetical protein
MKRKFVVSYDLRQPQRFYEPLWKRLGEWKAQRVLQSVWIIEWDSSCVAIRDDLQKYVDSNDGLLVAALTGESAWTKLDDQGRALKAA